MARVISSALAPLPSRIALEPRLIYEPGKEMTTLLNRVTELISSGWPSYIGIFVTLHADIVGEEDPVVFNNGCASGIYLHVLAPVVDYREAYLGIFFYEEF